MTCLLCKKRRFPVLSPATFDPGHVRTRPGPQGAADLFSRALSGAPLDRQRPTLPDVSHSGVEGGMFGMVIDNL